MSEALIRIEKMTDGASVLHMEDRAFCILDAEDALELDRLTATLARLPLSPGRAIAIANAVLSAFALGVTAGGRATLCDFATDDPQRECAEVRP